MSLATLTLIITLLPYVMDLGQDGLALLGDLFHAGAQGQDPTIAEQQQVNAILLSIHGEQSVVDQMVAQATKDAKAKIAAAAGKAA